MNCTATLPGGTNCPHQAEEGRELCKLHGGELPALRTLREKSLYKLDSSSFLKTLSQRATDINRDPRSRTLRNEIGILRATIERLLSSCDSDEALFLRGGEINNVMRTIESLMKTTFTIEKESGDLLNRDQALELASELVSVIITKFKEYYEEELGRAQALIQRLSVFGITDAQLKELDIRPTPVNTLLESISDAYSETLK